MILLGLHGAARSGKDTVRKYLEARHGFFGTSFAAPIKLAGAAKFGEPLELWEADGSKDAEIPGHRFTRREWMQEFGQWSRERWGADIWIRNAERRLDLLCDGVQRRDARGVVFSDVRHDNEAAFIVSRGGILWHLWRPERLRAAIVRDHISEHGVTAGRHPGRGILNMGSIEELHARVDKLLADLA